MTFIVTLCTPRADRQGADLVCALGDRRLSVTVSLVQHPRLVVLPLNGPAELTAEERALVHRGLAELATGAEH